MQIEIIDPIDYPVCKRCEFRPVTRGYGATLCDLCRSNDKHRHNSRKKSEIVVSVDSEGSKDAFGQMQLFTLSYGREDGSSGSILTSDAKESLLWLFDIAGDYGNKRQSFHAFHFNYDIAILSRPFDPAEMFLVHKSGARNVNLLCDHHTMHKPGERHAINASPCWKIHRYDTEFISAIITSGGEGDLLAYDPTSNLAIAATPKRRFYVEYRPEGDRYENHKILDIHDHGSAFVGGLEKVIDTWQPELTDKQRAIIKWGKEYRKIDGALSAEPQRTMEYSEAECVADARCVRMLIDTVRQSTGILIRPSKLYGSGSIAGAAFKYHGMQTREEMHTFNTSLDQMAAELAELTYFGGLIETPVVGLVDDIIDSEDINSAYPSHAIELPCMRQGHGYWERTKVRQIPATAVMGYVLASWNVKTPSTPPFVVHTTEKAVRQPLTGSEVWVTLPEYRAAVEQFGTKVIGTDVIWWQQDCGCENPLAWMSELYDKRNTIKAQMKVVENGSDEWQLLNVKQEAIKLVLNSCYGKLAQMRPEPGKYTNLHFAAYITGATRAQLRIRTWRKESMGGTIVYQHTDSVKFVGAILENQGKGLGKWGGEDPKEGMIILQPGLAAPLHPTDKRGNKTKGASRGAAADDFYNAARLWAQTQDLTIHPTKWKPLTIPTRRMTSRRMALHRGKPETAGNFVDGELNVVPSQFKRNLKKAIRMPEQPQAWIVPPIQRVDNPATLEDIRRHRAEVQRRVESGEFDDRSHN
jgi:hypothetical protein